MPRNETELWDILNQCYLEACVVNLTVDRMMIVKTGSDIIKLLLLANELLVPACEAKCMIDLLKEVGCRTGK